jgi:hypothetical protein
MVIFLLAAFLIVGSPATAEVTTCSETSTFAQKACYNSATEAYNLALGKCENVAEGEQAGCEAAARKELADSRAVCDEQFSARQKVCVELGGGPYLPNGITPFVFVDPTTGNNYFPLSPATYEYQSYQAGVVVERGKVEVTDGTREIAGVTCRVVRDIVTDPSGVVTEDTTDWYAQDDKGNVWYFGEIAQQFEDAILVGIEGSWTTGKDGAKPGFIMRATPKKGNVYRQEFALGDAEDMARVVGFVDSIKNLLPANVKLPSQARTGPYLHTQDFTALDPASVLEGKPEDKYYAPGVGLVLTIAPDGTKEVLVSIKH